MVVRVEINVKQQGSTSSFDPSALAKSLDAAAKSSQTLLRVFASFAKDSKTFGTNLQTSIDGAIKTSTANMSKLGLGLQRTLEAGAKAASPAVSNAITQSFAAALQRLGAAGSQFAAAGRTFTTAFTRFGAEAGGAFQTAFGGALSSGNLLRGSGQLASAASRLGGSIGQSLAQAAGAAFKLLPGAIGSALSGVAQIVGQAFSAAGALAGVLAGAAADIAGVFADKLETALKITVAAAVAVGLAGVRLAVKGEALAPAFENIAKATGDTLPSALAKLRSATQGTISDLDLMRNANLAVNLGAANNVEEFGRLADVAIRLGRSVGRDAADAISDLTIGLGRASPRILDNIGIQVRLGDVYGRAALALGKNAENLSLVERRTALLNAVMEQAQQKFDGQRDSSEVAAASIARFGSSIENATRNVGNAFLPALERLAPSVNLVASALENLTAKVAVDVGKKIADWVGAAEGPLTKLATIINGLDFEGLIALGKNAFETLAVYAKAAFEGVGQYLKFKLFEAILSSSAYLQSFVTDLPFVHHESTLADFQKKTSASAAAAGKLAAGVNFAPNSNDDLAKLGNLGLERFLLLAKAQTNGIGQTNFPPPASTGGGGGTTTRPGAFTPAGAGLAGGFGPSGNFTAAPVAGPEGSILGRAFSSFVPPDMLVGLAPLLNQIADSIAAAEEPTKALEEVVAAFRGSKLAQEAKKVTDALTDPFKEAIESLEAETDRAKELYKENEDVWEEARREQKRLAKALAKGLSDIAEDFVKDQAEVVREFRSKIDDALKRTQQRADQLLGLAGGIEPGEESLPPKFRRAAAKVRRQAAKERRTSLTSLSDRLSADDLARDGGAKLTSIIAQQAAIETGQAAAIKEAFDEAATALQDLTEKRIQAEEELRDTIKKAQDEQLELERKSVELMIALTDQVVFGTAERERLKAKLAEVEKKLNAIESIAARAAR